MDCAQSLNIFHQKSAVLWEKHCASLFKALVFFAENERQILQEYFFIKICIYIHL